MTYTVWSDLSRRLEANEYGKYYFTGEKFKADNPLECLVVLPGVESFYGTRVLNLFIVSRPYGWEKNEDGEWGENWPPEGFDDAVIRHVATYEKFTSYKTWIFMDYNFVRKLEERVPDTRIREMMDATKTRLQDLCNSLVGYGFKMGPDIENEVGAEFFAPYLNTHFGINQE